MRNTIGLAVLATCLSARVWAADPQSLSTDVPVQVEDAFPTAFGGMTLQNTDVYTDDNKNSKGANDTQVEGVVKIGALPGLQVDIGPSYNFGDQSNADSGDGTIDALYQFNDNTTYLPAFAAHIYYEQPYGAGHQSQEWVFRGIATKYLGSSDRAPRLDINLTDYHLAQPSSTDRSDQLEAIVGLSADLDRNTAIVGDVVHGDLSAVGQVENFVDVGLRHTIAGDWAIGGGVGAGIAQQSPAFRVFFSLQKDVNLF
jgi:hypothetical protein